MTPDNGGLRFNDGKPVFSLIPPEAMFALAQHFTVGATKYKPRNWERGMDWDHCFNAIQRHSWAWYNGEDHDPETGTHHMICVAWNALALFVYFIRGIGRDNRPQGSSSTTSEAQSDGTRVESTDLPPTD